MGSSPMGSAQSVQEAQEGARLEEAGAGWLRLGLALAAGHAGTSRRGRARSTLGTSKPLLIVSEEQKHQQGRPVMRARGRAHSSEGFGAGREAAGLRRSRELGGRGRAGGA